MNRHVLLTTAERGALVQPFPETPMKMFRVSYVKDGAWTNAVIVAATDLGNFLTDKAVVTPGEFRVEYVGDTPAGEPVGAGG